MQYVIFVEGRMWCAPVDEVQRSYLVDAVLPAMRPLSEPQYREGPAGLLSTAARASYVLDRAEVLWCVECPPGLLALRFSPAGEIAYAQVRSAGDAEDDDPHYDLIFQAWDARFGGEHLDLGYTEAGPSVRRRWRAAMRRVEAVGRALQAELAHDPVARHAWLDRCRSSPLLRGEPL